MWGDLSNKTFAHYKFVTKKLYSFLFHVLSHQLKSAVRVDGTFGFELIRIVLPHITNSMPGILILLCQDLKYKNPGNGLSESFIAN